MKVHQVVRSPTVWLAGATLLRLIVAALLPVTPDEAYYWVWSRGLQGGYLDHPPMVALWIRAGTDLFGDNAFGIRVLAPLATAVGTVMTVAAARDLFRLAQPDGRENARAIMAGVLLNATLALGVGSVTMTPDTPLLFFVALFLLALARVSSGGSSMWWLAVGAAVGLGFDSKYTMAMPAAGLAVWLVLTKEGRRRLARPWPWLAAVTGAVLTAPVFWWNATHGWASFVRQGGRAADWRPARAAQFLGELLGGQVGLATPAIFALFVVGVWNASRRRDAADRLLLCLVGVPLAVFAQHALGDRVQANWPVIIYPVFAVLAARVDVRWRFFAAFTGVALSVLVILQALTAVFPLGRHLDVALRQGGGWPAFVQDVHARTAGAAFVAADDYGLASELALRLPGRVVAGADERWTYFGLHPVACAGDGYLLHNARRDPPGNARWMRGAETVATVIRARRGVEAERYVLYRLSCSQADFYRLPPAR